MNDQNVCGGSGLSFQMRHVIMNGLFDFHGVKIFKDNI